MRCPNCQARQPDGNRFCGHCGAALAVAPLRPAGERRQMTIVFYDLVGSTDLGTRSDPEDYSEAVEHFHHEIGAAMRSLGGYVGSRVGDGAVVYFGYPSAQEDSAERAVLAGLRAVEVSAEVLLPGGEAAQIRIGVATGQGIINRSDDDARGNEVVGTVANLAARLQGAAQPGAVVVSEATRRLVGGLFDLEDLGELQAKGFRTPVHAWRVVGESQGGRFEAPDASQETPLIGRTAERERLSAALKDAAAGQGRVVLLTGEPGLGKSRLAAEFARQAQADGVTRINLHCAAHSQEAPLRPFIRNLQRANGADENGGGRTLTTLRGLAPGTDPDDAALLARLLGLPAVESPALQALTPARRLDRTIEALLHQLELLCRQGVVLVVFEDLHWVDPTSLSLLERAVRGGRIGGALILITSRPEFRPSWLGEPNVDEIVLAPMSTDDAAALIYCLAGSRGLTPTMRRAILDRADGVPLFLEELTRSTLEVAAEDGGDLNAYDLPMTLQDSLLARLDRMGPAKQIAQVAAVIGRRFPRRLVAGLSDLEPAEQIRALQRLVDAGLIEAERPADSQSYRFRHVLIQQIAYGGLLRGERHRLNAKLLRIIEDESPGIVASEPERLAHYAGESGQAEVAAKYWLAAGLQALAQTAMSEACSRLRQGLRMVARLPQDPVRWHIELKLELALGKALIATIGYALPETGATFARAQVLCEAIGDKPELLAVLHGLWIHDLLCGRLRSARTRADDLLQLAESEQDDAWTLIGCRARGVLGYPLGEYELSRSLLERGLALFAPERRPEYALVLVDDPRVVMLMYLSWVLIFLDRVDEAMRAGDDCLKEARALGQPYNLAHALAGRVLCGLFVEEYDGLMPMIEELAELTAKHEISFYAAVCRVLRGRYLARTGAVEEGARALEAALATYRATGSILYLPTFMMWQADALGHAGQPLEALALLDQAKELIDQSGMENDAAEIRRVEGDLHRLAGAPGAAKAAYEAALPIAARQGAKLYERRALASLAALAGAPRTRAPRRTTTTHSGAARQAAQR